MDFVPVFDTEPPPMNDEDDVVLDSESFAKFTHNTTDDWGDFSNFESAGATDINSDWNRFSPPPLSPAASSQTVLSNGTEDVKQKKSNEWGSFSNFSTSQHEDASNSNTLNNSTKTTSTKLDYSVQLRLPVTSQLEIEEKSGFGLFYKDDSSGELETNTSFGDFTDFASSSNLNDNFDNVYFKNDTMTNNDKQTENNIDIFTNKMNENITQQGTSSNRFESLASDNFGDFSSIETNIKGLNVINSTVPVVNKDTNMANNSETFGNINAKIDNQPKDNNHVDDIFDHEKISCEKEHITIIDTNKMYLNDNKPDNLKVSLMQEFNMPNDCYGVPGEDTKQLTSDSTISQAHDFKTTAQAKGKTYSASVIKSKEFGDISTSEQTDNFGGFETAAQVEESKDVNFVTESEEFGDFGTSDETDNFGGFETTAQIGEIKDVNFVTESKEFGDLGTSEETDNFDGFETTPQIEESKDVNFVTESKEFGDLGTSDETDNFGDFETTAQIGESKDVNFVTESEEFGDFGTSDETDNFGDFETTAQIEESKDGNSVTESKEFGDFGTSKQTDNFGDFETTAQIKESKDVNFVTESEEFGDFGTSDETDNFGDFETTAQIEESKDGNSVTESKEFGDFGTSKQTDNFGDFETTAQIEESKDVNFVTESEEFGDFGTSDETDNFGDFETTAQIEKSKDGNSVTESKEFGDFGTSKQTDNFGDFETTAQMGEIKDVNFVTESKEFGDLGTSDETDNFGDFETTAQMGESKDGNSFSENKEFGDFGTSDETDNFGDFKTTAQIGESKDVNFVTESKEIGDLDTSEQTDNFGDFETTAQIRENDVNSVGNNKEFGDFGTSDETDNFGDFETTAQIGESKDVNFVDESKEFGDFGTSDETDNFGDFETTAQIEESKDGNSVTESKEFGDFGTSKQTDNFGDFETTAQIEESKDVNFVTESEEFGDFGTSDETDNFGDFETTAQIEKSKDGNSVTESKEFGDFGTSDETDNFGDFETTAQIEESKDGNSVTESKEFGDFGTSKQTDNFGGFANFSPNIVNIKSDNSWNAFPTSSNNASTKQLVSKCLTVVASCFPYLDAHKDVNRKRLYDLLCHLNNSSNPDEEISLWEDLQMESGDGNRWLNMYFVSDSFKTQIVSFDLDYVTIHKKTYNKSVGRLTPSLSPATSIGSLDIDAPFGILQPEPAAVVPSKNTLLAQSKKSHVERVPSLSSIKRESGSEPTSETASLDLDFFITGSSTADNDAKGNVNLDLCDIDLSAFGNVKSDGTEKELQIDAKPDTHSSLPPLEGALSSPTELSSNTFQLRNFSSSDDGFTSGSSSARTHDGEFERTIKEGNLSETKHESINYAPSSDISSVTSLPLNLYSRVPPKDNFKDDAIKSLTPTLLKNAEEMPFENMSKLAEKNATNKTDGFSDFSAFTSSDLASNGDAVFTGFASNKAASVVPVDPNDKYSFLYELQETVGSQSDLSSFSNFTKVSKSSPDAEVLKSSADSIAVPLERSLPDDNSILLSSNVTEAVPETITTTLPYSSTSTSKDAFSGFESFQTEPVKCDTAPVINAKSQDDGFAFNAFGNLQGSEKEKTEFSDFSTANGSFGDFAQFESSSVSPSEDFKNDVSALNIQSNQLSSDHLKQFVPANSSKSVTSSDISQSVVSGEQNEPSLKNPFDFSLSKENTETDKFANFKAFEQAEVKDEVKANDFGDFFSSATSATSPATQETNFTEFADFTSVGNNTDDFTMKSNISTAEAVVPAQVPGPASNVLIPQSGSNSVHPDDKYSAFKNLVSPVDTRTFSLQSSTVGLQPETISVDPNDKYSVFKNVNSETGNRSTILSSPPISSQHATNQLADSSFGEFSAVSSTAGHVNVAGNNGNLTSTSRPILHSIVNLVNSSINVNVPSMTQSNNSASDFANFASADSSAFTDFSDPTMSMSSNFTTKEAISSPNFGNFEANLNNMQKASTDTSGFTSFSNADTFNAIKISPNSSSTVANLSTISNNEQTGSFNSPAYDNIQTKKRTSDFSDFASFESAAPSDDFAMSSSLSVSETKPENNMAVTNTNDFGDFGGFTDFQSFPTPQQANDVGVYMTNPNNMPPQTNQNFNMPPPTNQNFNIPPQTNQNFNIPLQTNQNFNIPPQTNQNFNMPPQTNQNFNMSPQTNQNFNMPPQTNQNFNMPLQTNQNFSMPTQVNQNSVMPPQTNQNFNMPPQNNQNFNMPPQTNQNFNMPPQSNQNQNFNMFSQANQNYSMQPQANQKFNTQQFTQNYKQHQQASHNLEMQANQMPAYPGFHAHNQNQFAPNQPFVSNRHGFFSHSGAQQRHTAPSKSKYHPPPGGDPFAAFNLRSNAEKLSLPVTNKSFQKPKPKLNQIPTKGSH
ncbi:uncharacterized protein LOC130658021 [Hydractinia symbiolongicarpus]|uniref:uncharacterized protein LOC130658021 n=1 Tax=Hydractinia symbiolongicarpus TaxID=13093 RepID=UPI002551495C|nr:uncharacterized protein LOC130658021 [Hydractinia symbiolongicarpus]